MGDGFGYRDTSTRDGAPTDGVGADGAGGDGPLVDGPLRDGGVADGPRRDGRTPDARRPDGRISDTVAPPVYTLRAPHYLRNVGSTIAGVSQWTTVVVANHGAQATTLTVRVYRADGNLLHTFTKALVAKGVWSAFGDADWLAVPDTSAGSAAGWVELSATQPIVGTQRLFLRSGTTYNAPLVLFDQVPLSSATATNLYGSFYLKNWGSNVAGVTQWSSVTVTNPNAAAATLTVRVWKTDGSGQLATFTKTLPARGSWNAYGDADWLAIPDTATGAGIGWVELSATRPVFGLNRVALRQGAVYNGTAVLVEDAPLATRTATTTYGAFYLKNWGSNIAGVTQWTSPVVINPNASAATVTVRIWKTDGSGQLASFTKTVPARGWWNAYGDADWLAIPDTATGAGIGWVELVASQAVFGHNRLSLRQGGVYNGPVTLLDDQPLTADTGTVLEAPLYLKNVPSGLGNATQWFSPVVVNPGSAAATLTVRVRRNDGTAAASFGKTIPARGWWNAYGDADWNAIPDLAGGQGSGWVELSSSQAIFALGRLALRDGTTYSAPVVQLDDDPFTAP
ncbi:MAG: hypothetical protein IT371_23490 [Deltaproteobacteria bacterium]|nr:hypothetical protein [Deltaproteobacteria bacterium]